MARGLTEAQLGGSLDDPVSRAEGGALGATPARYFVIHDTSSPYLRNAPFSDDLDQSATVNDLNRYRNSGNEVAHIFVNRLGATLVGHDFRTPWRATKLETIVVGAPSKGLFLHVEMIQPRRRDPAVANPNNDRFAPSPGFSATQYERLALLYVLTSLRAGSWLIPAFHAAIDDGISNGHDDPQNFCLKKFDEALAYILRDMS